MISKDSFVRIMDALRDYYDKLNILYSEFDINLDDDVFTRILDDTLGAIVNDVEPEFDEFYRETPWCYYYALECDWGRNEKAKEDVKAFSDRVQTFTSAEKLYDFLIEINRSEKDA